VTCRLELLSAMRPEYAVLRRRRVCEFVGLTKKALGEKRIHAAPAQNIGDELLDVVWEQHITSFVRQVSKKTNDHVHIELAVPYAICEQSRHTSIVAALTQDVLSHWNLSIGRTKLSTRLFEERPMRSVPCGEQVMHEACGHVSPNEFCDPACKSQNQLLTAPILWQTHMRSMKIRKA
jgi:hypothetical protein